MKKQYDIFISYKRKSFAVANNLYCRLTTRGYSTFYDLEELNRDNFDTQLLYYIENAKDVFVLLEEGSLDACMQGEWTEDWFCKEIIHALKTKRNIIPVLIGNYQMPQPKFLPDELKELSLKNAPEFSFYYFEEYLDKLIGKGFITSKAQMKNKTTSIFKLYADSACLVYVDGKLVCNIEGMSDEPYYLPMQRKGDYRFNVIFNNGKKLYINGSIDHNEEKIIHISNTHGNYKPIWLLYTICCFVVVLNIFIIYNYINVNREISVVYQTAMSPKGNLSTTITEMTKTQDLVDENIKTNRN